MGITKKLLILSLAVITLLCSCGKANNDDSANSENEAGISTVKPFNPKDKATFSNAEFKGIIAETLGVSESALTYEHLNEISGIDVYYYAERVGNTNEYKPIWSVTIKKNGFDEVFDKYYNTPKEEREGLESPSDYSYNKQTDTFDGYKDIMYFTNLKELSFNSEYTIMDFDPVQFFENLTNLESLTLYNYVVTDIERISKFSNLEKLSIGLNLRNVPDGMEIDYIDDISPLSKLKKLEVLSLYGNAVSDITPLISLTKLKELYIIQAALSDVSAVAEMDNLVYVSFMYNAIQDVTPFTKMDNIETINLDYNYIQDISPFANLDPEKIQYVSVDMNAFSDDTPLKHLGKNKVNLGYDPYWDFE